jgi:thymidylate synthase (FAD)
MKLVEPEMMVVSGIESPAEVIAKIERAGRVCYHSEPSATPEKAEVFIRRLIKMGHESVIEHHSATCFVTCSRSCAQQITRHRLASYSMESQRYVAYDSERHGAGSIDFVMPEGGKAMSQSFLEAFAEAEAAYNKLRAAGVAAEDARAVLPNAVATHLYMTADLREWRHFIEMRADPRAQGEIRELARQLHAQLVAALPCLFDDIVFK